MLLSKCLIGALMMATVSTAALAKTTGPTLRDRQQAACYTDAQKLCGEFIPDVDKVTVCMDGKRDKVSSGCAAMYNVKD